MTMTLGDRRQDPAASASRLRDLAWAQVGIAIDDRRRSLAEERFEVAFNEAPVASVITTGVRQLILDVNPAFESVRLEDQVATRTPWLRHGDRARTMR